MKRAFAVSFCFNAFYFIFILVSPNSFDKCHCAACQFFLILYIFFFLQPAVRNRSETWRGKMYRNWRHLSRQISAPSYTSCSPLNEASVSVSSATLSHFLQLNRSSRCRLCPHRGVYNSKIQLIFTLGSPTHWDPQQTLWGDFKNK